jgi:hypothetical protein
MPFFRLAPGLRCADNQRMASPTSSDLINHQVELNTGTADNWMGYAPHRRRVTGLIIEQRQTPSARVAVLGAGNCNDLDLAALGASFASIDLFDLDAAALARGVKRQGAGEGGTVILHGGVDLSGALDGLGALGNAAEMRLAMPPAIADRTFDVVASTCLLSQIVQSAVRATGETDVRLVPVVLGLRQAHFGWLARMLAPGGTGVFVSDLVSSDSCPELLTCNDQDAASLMDTAIRKRNFFTGLNPYAILQMVQDTGELNGQLTSLRLHDPWIWTIGKRAALVYAITFHRRGSVQRGVRQQEPR